MGQLERTGELFDFLYRDNSRLGSYYAQLFQGRLLSLEKTESAMKGGEAGGTIGIPTVFGGGVKRLDSTQESNKQVLDPHDQIPIDVLSFLSNSGLLFEDVSSAPNGSLIHAEGTVRFFDRTILKFMITGLEATIQSEKKKPRKDRTVQIEESAWKQMKKILESTDLPSAYVLDLKSGERVMGTIKEAWMEEAISTYNFRHGGGGLGDVRLVGIKEIASADAVDGGQSLLGLSAVAAHSVQQLFYPGDALKVTPIAIFRVTARGIAGPKQ